MTTTNLAAADGLQSPRGIVFDIKELSVYDGPGIRTTVFLKGCPLRCAWCHNPEGLNKAPQVMVSAASCVHCGRCIVSDCAKNRTGACDACGRCVNLCPKGLRKISGTVYTADELARRVCRFADIYGEDGGVTFSGGEPTYQPSFLMAAIDKIREFQTQSGRRFSVALETCGYCGPDVFEKIIKRCDLVFFDIKHTDASQHMKYTGVDNGPILKNLALLKASGVPFTARLPLIRGVNDSEADLRAAAKLLADAPSLLRAELLPYNMAAGAKYAMVGMEYAPPFTEGKPNADTSPFEELGIKAVVL